MLLETKRQLIHMGMGFFIFLFPWLDLATVRGLLFGLLIVTIVVVPRLTIRSHVYRPQDFSSGFAFGALSYFGTLLVLSYSVSLPILAGSWALLSFGDGAATLYASHKPGQPLPWNPKKSYAGMGAFMVIGLATCFAAILLVSPMLDVGSVLVAAIAATLIAGIVETIPIAIDDNITISLVAALVLTVLL